MLPRLPHETLEDIERRAVEWAEALDKSEKVGSRHHTVPRFHLERFADKDGRLWVRDRESDLQPGTGSLRKIDDMGIKDFYTSVIEGGGLDSRLEQVLAWIEGEAAAVLRTMLSPFVAARRLSVDEDLALSRFLAFQQVRGPRWRREIELMGDYYVKTMATGRYPESALADMRFVPHPNEHLKSLGEAAQKLQPWILGRPNLLVIIDQPLVFTCDEPVILMCGDTVEHLPDCGITEEQFLRRMKKRKGRNGTDRRTIHVYPARPRGVAFAEEIVFPLAPNKVLILGPRGMDSDPVLRLAGEDALQFASDVNAEVLANAYQWVGAHPGHDGFRQTPMAPPGPLVNVCDGGTFISKGLQQAPSPRSTARLRKDWR